MALAVGLLAPPADARPAALTTTPSVAAGSSLRPGAVVRLQDTPHLWIVGWDGLLHWGGDTRALADRYVNWNDRRVVSLEELQALPLGDPWLSAGPLKSGDPIYLAKWETDWAEPQLLHIPSIGDVELFGIDERNYGRMIVDQAPWERRHGFAANRLPKGTLERATSPENEPTAPDPSPVRCGRLRDGTICQTTDGLNDYLDWLTSRNLRNERLPLDEIATARGYFSRAGFEREVRLTPAELRRVLDLFASWFPSGQDGNVPVPPAPTWTPLPGWAIVGDQMCPPTPVPTPVGQVAGEGGPRNAGPRCRATLPTPTRTPAPPPPPAPPCAVNYGHLHISNWRHSSFNASMPMAVLINGVQIGVIPMYNWQIAPGRYRLTLRLLADGRTIVDRWINITPCGYYRYSGD